MKKSALISTRKGLFSLEKNGSGWEVDLLGFLADPVTMSMRDKETGRIYTSLNLGHFGVKFQRSDDNGKTWTEGGVPTYPDEGKDESGKKKGKSLVQIWSLESSGEKNGLWAGTIPGGLFHSADGGDNWTLNETLWNKPERPKWFGGGYDDAGIHSICVHPENSNRVTLGISCGGVWVTEDKGKTWENQCKGMYAEYMPPDRRDDPTIQDPHLVVQCPSAPDHYWSQHHNGVFRSRDGSQTWDDISPMAKPSKFGFAVAVHPKDPETAWFVPAVKDEKRVPMDGSFVVSRTRDGGKTFEVLRNGLPQKHAYDLVYRHALDIDDRGDTLVMGSTTGGLWVSEDGGDGWQLVNAHMPPIYAVRFD